MMMWHVCDLEHFNGQTGNCDAGFKRSLVCFFLGIVYTVISPGKDLKAGLLQNP